ncbi:hypothetical protein BGZ80_000012 [Entomortierella chlamydospora]|uniref:Palmitoyl-protein thioesterase 1 n=1 Tax=Entomortierella chlamydospora TaxID=101097 RepID=A0A9P6N7H5_9FUNG|nr:hypothetical protein BGZ79_000059 [Entomortierella chlamydospora]KAG0024884.1 hypothetical protein BGZ80_000012 [Entomortierella chlamydospora]
MGDSAHSKGMLQLFDSIKEIAPEIFIHSIYLAESEKDDQRAGFFGNVNNQIEIVCQQLRGIQELKDGFNAVGFSQGGQFLRAYIQRCNDPPVHNLITVGSQHGGVSDIPGCIQSDASCRLMRSIARSGVYSGYVRDHIVQAQYYKDPNNLQTYLERSIFLPDINNELVLKNAAYAERLSSINKFVMFMFLEDITVKPKETSWFGFQDDNGDVIDLEDQDQYKEDWLGLRTMDEAGKLIFDILEGEHMQFSLEDFTEKITIPYLLEIDDDHHENRKSKDRAGHHKHGKGRKHRCNHRHKWGRPQHQHQGLTDQSDVIIDWEMTQNQ